MKYNVQSESEKGTFGHSTLTVELIYIALCLGDHKKRYARFGPNTIIIGSKR